LGGLLLCCSSFGVNNNNPKTKLSLTVKLSLLKQAQKKRGRELGWRWEVGDGGKGHTRFIVDRCFSQKHTLSNMYFPFRHDVNAKEVQHKPCFLLSYLLTFVGIYIYLLFCFEAILYI
jgi:hypothetical protein